MAADPLDLTVDLDDLEQRVDALELAAVRMTEQLDRIEAKVDSLLALLDRYRPLLDRAEARFARPPMFGARKAQNG